MADNRKTLAQLKKLLFTRDEASTAQGIELLRSLGDPSLFDALLTGVSWGCRPPTERDPAPYGELTIHGPCNNAPATGRYDLVVALTLVAAAPPESAVAAKIIADTTSLHLSRGFQYHEKPPVDLEPLRAFTKLARLHVHAHGPVRNLGALAALPALRELTIDGDIADLAPLSGSRSLEKLKVAGPLAACGPLRDLPALREIDLSGSYNLPSLHVVSELPTLERLRVSLANYQSGDLGPLASLRGLRELRIEHGSAAVTSVEPLASLHALESLSLNSCGSITTLAPLHALPALRELHVASCSKLTTPGADRFAALKRFRAMWSGLREFDALADCALDVVEIDHCAHLTSLKGLRSTRSVARLHLHGEALTSFEGLEASESLTTLALRGAPSLTTLRHLAGAKSLQTLHLHRCGVLDSLDGLEGCAALTEATLEGGVFADLAPLASLAALERLSLRDCARVRDVTALTALPKLKALILAGTGVDRATLPGSLRAITSFAKDADLEKLAAKPPPEPRGPVIPKTIATEHRALWTKLKRLLLARDADTIDQGVELVRALGDVSIYTELLDGVTWTPPGARERLGHLSTAGSWFEDTAPAAPWRIRAVLALAAAAPDDCTPARALKESVTTLAFSGRTGPKTPAPFDAAPLTAFPKLTQLEIANVAALTHAETLGSLTKLTLLTLRHCGPWEPFEMNALAALETLTFYDAPAAQLSRLRDAPALREVMASATRGEGALKLDGHPTLLRLTLSSAPGVAEVSLRGCASLQNVNLSWSQGVERLDVTGCTALGALHFGSNAKLREVRGLATATALSTLDASGTPLTWLPTEPLDTLPHLFILRYASSALEDCAPLRVFPRVRTLDLNASRQLTSVRDLAALRGLQVLHLQWCDKLTSAEGLEGLPLHTVNARGCHVAEDTVPDALKRFFK